MVAAAEGEEEALVGAEIPPKYRDKSLWVRLRFDSFRLVLSFGLDELGVDEEDEDWVVGLLLEVDAIELVLALVLVLALALVGLGLVVV